MTYFLISPPSPRGKTLRLSQKCFSSRHCIPFFTEPNTIILYERVIYFTNIFPTDSGRRCENFPRRSCYLVHLIRSKTLGRIIRRNPRASWVVIRIFILLRLFRSTDDFISGTLKSFLVFCIQKNIFMPITKGCSHVWRSSFLPDNICYEIGATENLITQNL